MIAVLQWSVLLKRIQHAWRWIVFSSLAWIGGYILVFIFASGRNYLLGPVIGGGVGFMQWLLLRTEFDWATWWIFVSILAWTTGLNVMPGALTSGSLPGALTGLTLVILFRFSSKAREGLEKK